MESLALESINTLKTPPSEYARHCTQNTAPSGLPPERGDWMLWRDREPRWYFGAVPHRKHPHGGTVGLENQHFSLDILIFYYPADPRQCGGTNVLSLCSAGQLLTMSLYDDALPSLPHEIAVDAALFCENTAFSLAEEGLEFLEQGHFDFNSADHDLSGHIFSLEELFDAGINDECTLNHGDPTPLASAAPVDACKNKKSGLVTKECGHDAVCQCSKRRHRSSSHSPRRAKRCKPDPKPPRKIIKQGNRTRISQETRSFLESHFQEEQYPKQREVESLAQRCGITSKAVKNWFSNARARRTPGVLSVPKDVAAGASSPLLPVELYPHSQVATMSDGGVQLSSEAQMVSPAPSNLSLERYLASPPEDEPVSNAAIEDSIKADYLPILNQGLLQSSVEHPDLDAVPTNDDMDALMAAHLAMKQALMDSKMPSDDVPGFGHPAAPRNGSFASVASFDRGSRRGRRRWGGGSASHSVSDYGSPATPHTTQGDEFDNMLKIPTTG